MRARALMSIPIAMLLAAPVAHAQTAYTGGAAPTEAAPAPPPVDPSAIGGATYGTESTEPTAVPRQTVPGTKAKRLRDGTAAAPADAPPEVQEAVWAANDIVGKPYLYGGGHTRNFKSAGYDCSGTISYALNGAGLVESPLTSTGYMTWGEAGRGDWITVYANPGHAFVVIAGLRLDTSSAGERRTSGKGPRWRSNLRGGKGFRVRSAAGF